jgi:hypothetical protein
VTGGWEGAIRYVETGDHLDHAGDLSAALVSTDLTMPCAMVE